MKKHSLILILFFLFFTCKKEVHINFSQAQLETSEDADIAINYPKAEGDKTIAKLINNTLQSHIISQTNLNEETSANISLEEAVKRFNSEYKTFKTNFPDSSQKWEVFIDGEVTYTTPELISIGITTYLDTGGAHGNTNVKFFNFNPQTGTLLTKADLINNLNGVSDIIENELKDIVKSDSEDSMEDYFFGKDFQLPESIGFSDEGLIILYNPYEIASYAQGIIEFTIPFEDINSFITVN